MPFERSKTGQGAFHVTVADDGSTVVDGTTFPTAQAAYDHYKAEYSHTSSHAAWNICYHLEDHLVDVAA